MKIGVFVELKVDSGLENSIRKKLLEAAEKALFDIVHWSDDYELSDDVRVVVTSIDRTN